MGRKKTKEELGDAAQLFTEAQVRAYLAKAHNDAAAFEEARKDMLRLQEKHAGLRIL